MRQFWPGEGTDNGTGRLTGTGLSGLQPSKEAGIVAFVAGTYRFPI